MCTKTRFSSLCGGQRRTYFESKYTVEMCVTCGTAVAYENLIFKVIPVPVAVPSRGPSVLIIIIEAAKSCTGRLKLVDWK